MRIFFSGEASIIFPSIMLNLINYFPQTFINNNIKELLHYLPKITENSVKQNAQFIVRLTVWAEESNSFDDLIKKIEAKTIPGAFGY